MTRTRTSAAVVVTHGVLEPSSHEASRRIRRWACWVAPALVACSQLPNTTTLPAAAPPAHNPTPKSTEEPTVSATSPGEACTFDGQWTAGELAGHATHLPFARLFDAEAMAELISADGTPTLVVALTKGGWQLHGIVDLENQDALCASRVLQFGTTFALTSGSSVRVVGTESGQVQVRPTRFAFSDGFHFRDTSPIWVGCDQLSLSFERHNKDSERQQRLELGFGESLPKRYLPKGVAVSLSADAGGPPVVDIRPDKAPVAVYLVQEQQDEARVLIQHWTGAALVGWVPTEALAETSDKALGGLGLYGSPAGPKEITACRSNASLSLFVEFPSGEREEVGRIEPNTPFVRLRARHDGTLIVKPHPETTLFTYGNTKWMVVPSGPVDCAEETFIPSSSTSSSSLQPVGDYSA